MVIPSQAQTTTQLLPLVSDIGHGTGFVGAKLVTKLRGEMGFQSGVYCWDQEEVLRRERRPLVERWLEEVLV